MVHPCILGASKGSPIDDSLVIPGHGESAITEDRRGIKSERGFSLSSGQSIDPWRPYHRGQRETEHSEKYP
jgi:hypothetical protein